MAQPRVTDFFASKKKTNCRLPTKRRRVEINHNGDDISAIKESAPITLQTASLDHNAKSVEESVSISSTKPRRKPKKNSSKTEVSKPTARITRQKCVNNVLNNQQKINDALTNLSSKTLNSDVSDLDKTSKLRTLQTVDDCSEPVNEPEYLSLHWDEVDGSQNKEITPRKQIKTVSKKERKSRHHNANFESTTPCVKSSTETVVLSASTRSARKCLQLHPEDESMADGENINVDNMVSEMTVLSPKISPIPTTPQKVQYAKTKGPDEPVSSKVKASIKRCKELTESVDAVLSKTKKLTASEVKFRLKKGGKLEELKKQLLELNKLKKDAKKQTPKLEQFNKIEIQVEQLSPIKSPVKFEKSEMKVPAFEKFHHLVTSPPPTLTLPYKYRLLAEMFLGMDTVVSMVHNRRECCTYSKLKAAVQSMTKKNFEKKNIGQITTVYPTAYSFRQERVPVFGQKFSDYQLTVEARLGDDNDSKSNEDSQRQTFTASHLLRRRQTFKLGLISIVKRYHKDFISKLQRPLNIPDNKITRWHPGFPLDEVPDIEESPLPEAPVVYKYETAKDVLEHTRGKIIKKVEQALESVAATSSVSSKVVPKTEPKNESLKPESRLHKGIPLFLLEKIRAKEALKLEAALTRDPQEDKKTGMMGRLPDMIRMLRMYYISEKKPALPLESVVQKLCDSSKSAISLGEVEKHIKLLLEICPEWISVVEIKRGKYVKLDKNKDIQVLNTKIQSLIKERK
ncbi:DNA replication factor Cdt1-like [Gigantopelta aegis]|uniref:DNA replication factor Cdt1-like n=1 Tax=Gigantopelta aegis TaxID=1735272 RepID=UPI001B88A39A|nr:DNA replication factor Cdt1-like [Gigantopelta aegis]